MSASGRGDPGGAVLLGPSARVALLGPVLRALDDGFERLDSNPVAFESLEDLVGLLREWPAGALLVLDADAFEFEDLGFVRRFVARHPNASLLVLGDDPQTRVARALLIHTNTRWLAWPPDVLQLQALVSDARTRSTMHSATTSASATESRTTLAPPVRAHTSTARPSETDAAARAGEARLFDTRAAAAESFTLLEPGLTTSMPFDQPALRDSMRDPRITRGTSSTRNEADALVRTPLEREEIEAIQAILGGRPEPEPPVTLKPVAREPHNLAQSVAQSLPQSSVRPRVANAGAALEREPGSRPSPNTASTPPLTRTHPPAAGTREPRGPHATGRHMREQVADLADFVQRIELSLRVAREGNTPTESARRFDDLEIEITRLVQFARTLGFLVAPPGVGEQEFDLCELVHTTVAGAAARPDAPRCQFRTSGTALVRSDRRLLAQAFDAIFFLAARCTGAGELLRAQVRRENGSSTPRALVIVEFPAGPLESLALDQVLEPYGLRRTLPDLGPNALAAAIAIVEGQGGHVALLPGSKNHLQWRIELPALAEASVEPGESARSSAVGSGGANG